MCGLYGFTTNKNKRLSKEKQETITKIVKSLAITMEDRGVDSAGMAFVKNNQTVIVKRAVDSTNLLNTKGVKKQLETGPELVLGHTRLATIGDVNDKNAHPFIKGNIIGSHNGNVSNHLEIDNRADVDSETIFSLLNKSKNDFKKTFKKLSGSFAITWIDLKEPNTFYFVSQDNPLAIVYVSDLGTIFWSSTKRALRSALVASIGLDGLNMWYAKKNYVYKVGPRLGIEKYRVEFKEDFVYNNFKYDNDKNTNDDFDDDDDPQDDHKSKIQTTELIGGRTSRARENESLEITLDQAILHQIDNFGCELCQKLANPKQGFWWNFADDTFVCTTCFTKIGHNLDYEFISYPEYLKISTSNRSLLAEGH